MKRPFIAVSLFALTLLSLRASPALEENWNNPPQDARVRAYWWWLNGNVTRESITADLEAMKAKGFGGALICDADGSSQDGNARVPHGPDFASPAWRELYKHALREAARLGLEMSLNIQSGWNLGGPMVTQEDAPKQLAWTETPVSGGNGGTRLAVPLPKPKARDNFYRDLYVLAYPAPAAPDTSTPSPFWSASSAQPDRPAALAADGRTETFWVSSGKAPGEGPTAAKPESLQVDFGRPLTAASLILKPRDNYGPKSCSLEASDDGKTFRPLATFSADARGETRFTFPPVSTRALRLVVTAAFDPNYPNNPRNVQIADLVFLDTASRPLGLAAAARRPLQNQEQKALRKPLQPFSAPSSAPLFQEFPAVPGEQDARVSDVIDLSDKLSADGTLTWDAPAGDWIVLRFGYTLNDHCRVSTNSQGWDGYALDPFDDGALIRYWDAVVAPLITDAGPLAGKTLRYLHTDSWEVEVANWTPFLREEFQNRRGYDIRPWLPVIAGKILNSRDESNRFLQDLRRTFGDLAIDHHYKIFKERAHAAGMLIHPESGGPHAVPIDAQQCLGYNDAPMSEFWATSWKHRIGDENRFFVKQPASAAHTYGRKLVLAEGFTTIGPHWQETLLDNLKPAFDHALTEGLNLLVWHAFVNSPKEQGLPGQQYFAGTHLNPQVTWWSKSAPLFAYFNRCHALLQLGLPFSDVAYYYGDHVPNFTQLRNSDPAKIGTGYDYDVVTAEVILTRMSVRDGRLVLPDGVSYRVLVLPPRDIISLPVLRKLREFALAGATIVGPRPARASGLSGFPGSDAEVARLAVELWGGGLIREKQSAADALQSLGVTPDFTCTVTGDAKAEINFIHRIADGADIYFVANRSASAVTAEASFRVSGKAPELWDAVTGATRLASAYRETEGRTVVPLSLQPFGSTFVVFRHPSAKNPPAAGATTNAPATTVVSELTGPWQVAFDPQWGGPASVEFASLESWTLRPEPGIKFYSGTATYRRTLKLPVAARADGKRLFLDLGAVRELAEVKLNGRSCGIVWAPPFQVDITDAVRPGSNALEIEVVNFWPNRLIGDTADRKSVV